ncbi:hypothetical protein KR067_003147, partial [Drosophila pandora]
SRNSSAWWTRSWATPRILCQRCSWPTWQYVSSKLWDSAWCSPFRRPTASSRSMA